MKPTTIWLVAASAAFVALSPCAYSNTSNFPTSEPLIYPSNLQYLGSFRLPNGSTNQTTFAFAGNGLGFDSTKNALFVTGHTWYQYTAEVSIPTPIKSTNLADLPTATVIQPLTDALDGQRASVNPTDTNAQKIGGYLLYNNNLIISVFSYYDGNGSQTASHFVRSPNLSATTPVQGPYRVGALYPGFVSGYMTEIPAEWQPLFGGPALTGNCCLNIISEQSSGPSVSVFNPNDLGKTSPVPSTELLGYPISHPLSSYDSQFTQPINATTSVTGNYFNGTTRVTGLVFPSGTSSVLFFGHQGLGSFCYGQGTSDTSIVGTQADGPSDLWCYDPVNAYKGTHAYPYTYEIWAYNANDLLKVKNGSEAPYNVRPYAVWELDTPIDPKNISHIGGAAYDPETKRLYVEQQCVDSVCSTIIDVYQINVSTSATASPLTTPSSPTSVTVQ